MRRGSCNPAAPSQLWGLMYAHVNATESERTIPSLLEGSGSPFTWASTFNIGRGQDAGSILRKCPEGSMGGIIQTHSPSQRGWPVAALSVGSVSLSPEKLPKAWAQVNVKLSPHPLND